MIKRQTQQKLLFNKWVRDNYPNKTKIFKIKKIIPFVYNLFEKEMTFKNKSNISQKTKLFNYFISLPIHKEQKVEKAEIQTPETRKANKSRNRIIKKAKGNINENCFYLSTKWLILKRKVHLLYKCGCMKCLDEKGEKHVDHILPRSKYPSLELDIHNLQILCRSCNMEKSNKSEIDYRTDEQRKLCSLKYP